MILLSKSNIYHHFIDTLNELYIRHYNDVIAHSSPWLMELNVLSGCSLWKQERDKNEYSHLAHCSGFSPATLSLYYCHCLNSMYYRQHTYIHLDSGEILHGK